MRSWTQELRDAECRCDDCGDNESKVIRLADGAKWASDMPILETDLLLTLVWVTLRCCSKLLHHWRPTRRRETVRTDAWWITCMETPEVYTHTHPDLERAWTAGGLQPSTNPPATLKDRAKERKERKIDRWRKARRERRGGLPSAWNAQWSVISYHCEV